jgi:hypothetical protein
MSTKNPDLTDDEWGLGLLGTFVSGPKIWDAATLFKTVCSLEAKGYVKFIGDGPKAEITDAGRAALLTEG